MKGSADRAIPVNDLPDAAGCRIGFVPFAEWICGSCRSVFLVESGRTPSECPVCQADDITPFAEAIGHDAEPLG